MDEDEEKYTDKFWFKMGAICIKVLLISLTLGIGIPTLFNMDNLAINILAMVFCLGGLALLATIVRHGYILIKNEIGEEE